MTKRRGGPKAPSSRSWLPLPSTELRTSAPARGKLRGAAPAASFPFARRRKSDDPPEQVAIGFGSEPVDFAGGKCVVEQRPARKQIAEQRISHCHRAGRRCRRAGANTQLAILDQQ